MGMQQLRSADMSDQRTAPKLHWWERKEIIIAFVIIGALVLIAVLIIAAHIYHWDLTTTIITEVTQSPQKKVTTTETGKTLLDWLQLLGVIAIPIAVGFGTVYFTTRQAQISEANRNQQHETDLQIAEKQQQQEFLQTYFDKMSEMLEKGLRKSQSDDEIRYIAQARTLAALRRLDAEHNRILLKFLFGSKLVQRGADNDIIELKNADLSTVRLDRANLIRVDLSQADLRESELNFANLSHTHLGGADLSKANLKHADLSGADLSKATLPGANLHHADLSSANLHSADLTHADLSFANLSGADLSKVYLRFVNLNFANLSGANLSGADLSHTHLSGADLSGANLKGAYLVGADLAGATFSKADLTLANLNNTDLSGATFYEANLIFTGLIEANLSGADMSGAILRGVNLSTKQLKKAINVTPEKLALIKSSKPSASQEAKTEQASATPVQSERKPDQTNQEEEQEEHTQPKQDTDIAH